MFLRAFTILFIYDLALPTLFVLSRPDVRNVYFNHFDNSSIIVTYLIWFLLSIGLIRPGKKIIFFHMRPDVLLRFLNKRIFEVFIIIFFLSSLYFYLNFDMSFRHLNRIKNTNFAVTTMFAFRPFFRLWILATTFKVIRDKYASVRVTRIAIVLGLSFYFSLTSASDVLTLIMCFALSISRRLELVRFYKVRLLSTKALLVSLSLVSVVYFGFANKKSFDQRINPLEFVDDFADVYLDALTARLSVHAASTFIAIDNGINVKNYQLWLSEIFFTQVNNGRKLIGDSYRDEINTLARRNYFYLFKEARLSSRTGTSPGFIPSFLYMPFFPLNLILGIAVFRFILVRLFHGIQGRLPNLLIFMSIFTLMPFLDGLQHIFFVIDPIAISFLYFILLTDNHVRV